MSVSWEQRNQRSEDVHDLHIFSERHDAFFSVREGFKYFTLTICKTSKDGRAIQKATWPQAAIAEARRQLDEIEKELVA